VAIYTNSRGQSSMIHDLSIKRDDIDDCMLIKLEDSALWFTSTLYHFIHRSVPLSQYRGFSSNMQIIAPSVWQKNVNSCYVSI